MRRQGLGFWLPCLLLVGGCAPHEAETALVTPSPFNNPPAPAVHTASYTTANVPLAARVDAVGRKLVAANKAFGVEPLFCTIGAPKPEIFHEGTQQVVITSALAEQCKTDGQLAAVLATELAKIVVEREAQARPSVRQREPLPSMNMPAGSGGAFSPADQVGLAEMSKFQPRRPASVPAPRLPDAQQLARTYLRNAQFPEAELEQASPLLNAAAANGGFERQMTATPNDRAWTKP